MVRSITRWDRRRIVRVGTLVIAVIVAAVVIAHQWSPSSATGDQEGGPSGSDVTPTADHPGDNSGRAAGGGGASGAIQTGALASPTEAVPTTPRVVPIGKEDGMAQPGAAPSSQSGPGGSPSGDQDTEGGTSP